MHVAVIAVGVDQRHRRLLGGICAERISRNRVFLLRLGLAVHDHPSQEVHCEGDHEQDQAGADQGRAAQIFGDREVERDVRRDGLRVLPLGDHEEGDDHRWREDHRNGHGLAERPAQAQHDRADHAGTGIGEDREPDHLPARGAQSQCGFFMELGGLQEDFPGNRSDDRQDHHGQYDGGGEDR